MKLFSAFVILWAFHAQAEFRMFLLEVRSADGKLLRQVASNLDPDQYPGYYPLQFGETVSYTETWMCRGRTGEGPNCKSPRQLAAEAAAAAATDPTSSP